MKAYKTSRSYETSIDCLSGAIDELIAEVKKLKGSWSSDRRKVAILSDNSGFFNRHFIGKSLVLDLKENGIVEVECADASSLLFNWFRESEADFTEAFLDNLGERIKHPTTAFTLSRTSPTPSDA
jgi:hypothetical protein